MATKNASIDKPQKKEVAKAVVWKFFERIGGSGVSFIISLILARILVPEDYGILGLLTIFMQVSSTLIDGGFSSALIQKNDCEEEDYCSVFWFCFFFSIVCYIILFFAAPFIAYFYNQNILTSVLRIIAITLVIGVFRCIPSVIINKTINFKITARISVFSNVISGIVAIIFAYLGFGVWALVIQHVIASLLIMFLYIFYTKWLPKFSFSFGKLKSLFSFGSKMMLLVFSSAIFDNIYGIIIGKKFNSAALGIYNRGENFPKLIVNNVSGSIENVIFPTLTYYTDDKEKALAIVRRFITLSTYCILPLMFGLAVVARPMILVLLTEKWIDCVFFVRMACIVYALNPLQAASFSSLYAFGKSGTALKFTILRYFIMMSALIISHNFGIKGMAVGYAIATVITIILDLFPLSKLLNYCFVDIVKDIAPALFLSILMFFIVFPITCIKITPLLQLIMQIIVGILTYIFFSYISKNKSFLYILENIKKIISKRKNNGRE